MDSGVHLTRWGHKGPLVVLVHGSAQGSEVGGERHFAKQAELTERGFQLVVPDRPGHGRSPAPGRPDDAEADGRWVADLLAGGAHLVGHSFGGCVALNAAALRPEAVRTLTLIEPAMMAIAMDDTLVRAFVGRIVEASEGASSMADRAVRFAKVAGIPDEIRGGSDQLELERIGQGLAQLKIPSPDSLRRELAVVKESAIPLMVITGGWNPALDRIGNKVAELGNGRHLIIKSDHHFPQLISGEFNETLLKFMNQANQPSTGRTVIAGDPSINL